MRLLFSFFMIPAVVAVVITALGGMLIYLDAEGFRPVENTHSFWPNLYFCLLHFFMAVTMGLSVLVFLYSCCLALFGFIVKTWFGALLAIAFAVFSFLLAGYLLNINI